MSSGILQEEKKNHSFVLTMASSRKRPRGSVSANLVPKLWSEGRGEKSISVGCEIPILHPFISPPGVMERKGHSNRQGNFRTYTSQCDLGECVHLGDIATCLHGQLNLATLVKDGKCFQLSLVLEGDSHNREEDESRWLLKLEVGGTVSYVELKMDPRFTTIPFHLLGDMWKNISSYVKLVLPQTDDNVELQQSLILEVWAMKKVCHFGYPFEPGAPLANRSHFSLLVKIFYPDVLSLKIDKG